MDSLYKIALQGKRNVYTQAAIKPNSLLRNGAYDIVMRGVQKYARGVHR